jgi:hypothetical protein
MISFLFVAADATRPPNACTLAGGFDVGIPTSVTV